MHGVDDQGNKNPSGHSHFGVLVTKVGLREDLHDIGDRGVQRGIKCERTLTAPATCHVAGIDKLDQRLVHILHGGTEIRIVIRIRVRAECCGLELCELRKAEYRRAFPCLSGG